MFGLVVKPLMVVKNFLVIPFPVGFDCVKINSVSFQCSIYTWHRLRLIVIFANRLDIPFARMDQGSDSAIQIGRHLQAIQ